MALKEEIAFFGENIFSSHLAYHYKYLLLLHKDQPINLATRR